MLLIKDGERIPQPEVIPTPSFGLNYVLGGGIWTGRLSLFWGNPSSGKTTFCLHTMARAQEMGYKPVILDAEGSYTDEWAERAGINMNNRILIRGNILEEVMKEIIPLMKDQNKKHLFLFDTINALVFEAFYKTDDGGNSIGMAARSQAYLLQKLAHYLHTNMAVLLVAQQSVHFSGQYAYLDAKAGNATKHWCTNIVHLQASTAKDALERDKNGLIVNRQISWDLVKTKQTPAEGTKGDYWFSPQAAYIDTVKEAVNLAVINGVIEKSGAWFQFNGRKYHGLSALAEDLKPDDIDYIFQALSTKEVVRTSDEL